VKYKEISLKKAEGSMKAVFIQQPHVSGFRKVHFIPLTITPRRIFYGI
jgi:hypothetical protein